MNLYRYFLPCLLLVAFSGYGQEPRPTEIRIELLSETTLIPIYISSFRMQGSSLPDTHIRNLEKILQRDFSYNGTTSTLPACTEKDQLLEKGTNPPLPKQIGANYALSCTLSQNKLQCKAFCLQEQTMKTFGEISLTGSLGTDRQKIHALSDAIYQALFQKEGVSNAKILFAYQSKTAEGSWISEIAQCDADGENVQVLTQENSYCITPVSIPKGPGFALDAFLYVSYKNGQPKIFLSSKEGGKPKRVVDIRGNQMLPAISPQRDKIAFICDASGRADLFVQPINPSNGKTSAPCQLFSYPRATQASPTFSPDGSQIAFVSDKDGAARIYRISSTPRKNRPEAIMLTKKNRENSCPCWSPDGSKLAYSAKTEGIRQIWIYDFTTQEEKQLTFGPGNKENPNFASDSLHLVFNSTDGNYSELYVVNLHQPDAIKISKGTGKKHYPVWSAR